MEQSEALVRQAGGAWNPVGCPPASLAPLTSASTPQQVAVAYGGPLVIGDGLPVEFSWPVRPSRVDPSDFRVTLNTGDVVTPQLASIDERSVVVVRQVRGTGSRRATRIRSTPSSPRWSPASSSSARTRTSSVPSASRRGRAAARTRRAGPGPRLVATKLTLMSAEGDEAPAPFDSVMPNSGTALYGAQARFRLRIYTNRRLLSLRRPRSAAD